jgi:quercetin dioxygenase-like cupin family protein
MRRRVALMCLVAIGIAAGYAATVRATPASLFSASTVAKGRFGNIHVENEVRGMGPWHANLETHGDSDLYVQSNVWAPGGSTGWHTHPGHSLIIVTAGTVTAYEGNDPTCTPHVYSPGMGFVDPGGDHVHLLRNEGAIEARTIAVQMVPAAAARRVDAADPGYCQF